MGQVEVQPPPQAKLCATKAKAAAAPWRLASPKREVAGEQIRLRAILAALVGGLLALIAVAPSATAATRSFVATDLGTLGGIGSIARG